MFIFSITVLISLLLFNLNYKADIELMGVIDQFNPFEKEENGYLKTKKPDGKVDLSRSTYTQKIYDKKGESRKITFTSEKPLKVDRYLMIKHKGAHVSGYIEVDVSDIPEKAFNEIEK